jgi:hypothetical protein
MNWKILKLKGLVIPYNFINESIKLGDVKTDDNHKVVSYKDQLAIIYFYDYNERLVWTDITTIVINKDGDWRYSVWSDPDYNSKFRELI